MDHQVELRAHATAIVLDGRRAVGVRYVKGGRGGAPAEVRARKEVILAGGEVQVRKQERLLNILKAGECFGEMAYLGKHKFKRSASVVAATDIVVIEIRAETLPQASELCRHHFNGAFLELLVDRLGTANLRLSQLLAEQNISVY